MQELNDQALLREYVRNGSDEAFRALVARHVHSVYSVALRQADDPHAAEDVTQSVFIILARKARRLAGHPALAGWLFTTVRLVAAAERKGRARRRRREEEACMHFIEPEQETAAAWQAMAPLLDEAIARLGERNRRAILLRYFENKSLREVGEALAVNEEAARKRTARAVEKLRLYFLERGVTLPVALLTAGLSARAVHAAPDGLAARTAASVLEGLPDGAPATVMADGALRLAAWTKAKTAGAVAACILATGGVAVLMVLRLDQPSGREPAPAMVSVETVVTGVQATGPAPVVENTNWQSPVSAGVPRTAPREPLAANALMTLNTPPGAVTVDAGGRILVGSSLGGYFVHEESATIGYYMRGALRLEPDGTLDRSFRADIGHPDSSASHRARIAVQQDGRIFISGFFDAVDGAPAPGYAMLLPDGRRDPAFEPWRGRGEPPGRTHLPGGTYPATLLADGSVAILSVATEGPRAPHPLTVHRLDPSGTLIEPAHFTRADAEFSRPSGAITTLGPVGFWARQMVDWTRETPAARRPPFNADGPASDLPARAPVADLPFQRWTEPPSAADAAKVFDALFDEVPLELVRYAARLPDGGVVLAIRDEVVDGSLEAQGRFMRFDRHWRPDFSFNAAYQADIRSSITLVRQPDGKLLVAGLVGTINGEPAGGVVRLDESGAIDSGFHCVTGDSLDGRVMDAAIQGDGRILICGYFTRVNGVAARHLARLNPDGSIDADFRPPFLEWETLQAARRVRLHRLTGDVETVPVPARVDSAVPAPGVTFSEETILITSIHLDAGAAIIRVRGRAGGAYQLQAGAALDGTEWTIIGSIRANASGAGVFRDEEAKDHAIRFYRIVLP